jgi:hypothetical protein
MLLQIFIFALILEYLDKVPKYRYSLVINPAGIDVIEFPSIYGGGEIAWAPEINFELKSGIKYSLNFAVNLGYWNGYDDKTYIYISEIEVGLRRYFSRREFRGFYLYFGVGPYFIHTRTEGGGISFERIIPNLIFTIGYKYISSGGITIDPFLALKFPYIPIPASGLYLGYSW